MFSKVCESSFTIKFHHDVSLPCSLTGITSRNGIHRQPIRRLIACQVSPLRKEFRPYWFSCRPIIADRSVWRQSSGLSNGRYRIGLHTSSYWLKIRLIYRPIESLQFPGTLNVNSNWRFIKWEATIDRYFLHRWANKHASAARRAGTSAATQYRLSRPVRPPLRHVRARNVRHTLQASAHASRWYIS